MAESLGRILIVDDEQPVLDVLSEYFQSQGYTTATAQGGAEALAVIERQRPDLVLLDVRMPGMDGLEVLRRVRQSDQGLAVIMVTANEDLALARETLKIGAFDYVAKPFDFQYLDRVVAAALVHAGTAAPPAPADASPACQALAVAVFRAVRAMTAAARAGTGQRLETAALAAAREAAAGRGTAAAQWVAEIGLLLDIAKDLGDLAPAARSAIEKALDTARAALVPR
jgi:two-component system response regulator (stage 0 sporulation protein F)